MHKAKAATPWRGDGRHAGATWLASPHFGPRPAGGEVSLIVLHSISLPPGEYGTQAVQRLFAGTLAWDAHPYFQSIRGLEVSAHFSLSARGACGSSSIVISAPGTRALPAIKAGATATTTRWA